MGFTDQLSITIASNNLLIGKGNTAQFNATTSGVSSEENNFMYEWIKRGSDSLPDKVSSINETVLTIPNAAKSDEGQYYCIVTNEWGRSVESSVVTLTVYGMQFVKYLSLDMRAKLIINAIIILQMFQRSLIIQIVVMCR